MTLDGYGDLRTACVSAAPRALPPDALEAVLADLGVERERVLS